MSDDLRGDFFDSHCIVAKRCVVEHKLLLTFDSL